MGCVALNVVYRIVKYGFDSLVTYLLQFCNKQVHANQEYVKPALTGVQTITQICLHNFT